MQNHEIIIVVNVYFRPLVNQTSAVFYVEGMEVKVFQKKTEILLRGIEDMMPPQRSNPDGLNHKSLF
jgi:hypothetical protein